MGLEKPRRKKEKKQASNPVAGFARGALLGAGALAAASAMDIHNKSAPTSDDAPVLRKSDREKLPRFRDFRRSENIEDRRDEIYVRLDDPLEQAGPLKSREEQDWERGLENSKLSEKLGAHDIGRTPREAHTLTAWNRKNQIDAAIKKVQRTVLKNDSDKNAGRKKKK